MAARTEPAPRTFFLNEQHELARAEKEGGPRAAQYGEIDWAERSERLSGALRASKTIVEASADPVRDRHYFLCAVPRSVPKTSKGKNKPPTYDAPTEYAGEHSRIFRRLGLDLIDVTGDGIATVHATKDRIERLLSTAAALEHEKQQERARWVTIDRFEPVPASFRVDEGWLQSLRTADLADVIVELQPLLGRVEVEDVLLALSGRLNRDLGEMFTTTGTDFSGRKWFRGRMRREAIATIAAEFFSVQSLHSPQVSLLSALRRRRDEVAPRATSSSMPSAANPPSNIGQLPTVAVVDAGVPAGHAELSPYRRGAYRWPDAYAAYAGDHGSFVASRVVFGDLDFSGGEYARPNGACQFLDVMVAKDAESIEDKAVLPALEAVIATYPDVRVFNLSFSQKQPLSAYAGVVDKREHLLSVQDLDNFVFARDVIVIVSAGNSVPGIVPTKPYPEHLDDEAWQLAPWPSGFNTLTCGSNVETLHPEGLVKTPGWPSPFTRVGPGIAGAPIPELGAHGGNLDDDWKWRPSLGVWGCSAAGTWEDHAGTSFAAPLLARQAALMLRQLERFCPPGVRPFAITAKAFLVLTATRNTNVPPLVKKLAERTLGFGTANPQRLDSPSSTSAVFVWQGIIEQPKEVVRLQLPIPLEWLAEAKQPELRIVCCWDPPVNEAARDLWATRKVIMNLRAAPGEDSLIGSKGSHATYPMIDRTYKLSKEKLAKLEPPPREALWDLEISYEQIAEYYPAITFAPQQRVALAAELRDAAPEPVSPQRAVQALPAAASMTRLGLPSAVAVPIIVRRG